MLYVETEEYKEGRNLDRLKAYAGIVDMDEREEDGEGMDEP